MTPNVTPAKPYTMDYDPDDHGYTYTTVLDDDVTVKTRVREDEDYYVESIESVVYFDGEAVRAYPHDKSLKDDTSYVHGYSVGIAQAALNLAENTR
jgi:hypothetical protein